MYSIIGMGSSKKHKIKKHKTHSHSREIQDVAESTSGKMKFVFRVPPPLPSSPLMDDQPLLVSLPLEDIARARQSLETGEHQKPHRKKTKKKHHHKHHQHHSLTSDIFQATGLVDISDEEIQGDEEKAERRHREHQGGKTYRHYRTPGKEMSYQRIQSGPFLQDEEEEEGREMEEEEISSLPVEISLEKLNLSSKRPIGSGKGWKTLKVSKITSPPVTIRLTGNESPLSTSYSPTIPIPIPKSSSPLIPPVLGIKSPPTKSTHTSPAISFSSSTEKEKKKKKKKKKHKHHYHDNATPTKFRKLDGKGDREIVEPVSSHSMETDVTPKQSLPIHKIPVPLHPNDIRHEDDEALMGPDSVSRDSDSFQYKLNLSPEGSIMSALSPASSISSRLQGTKLPRSALRYFLKHLHHLVQRNDPEGVFAEPVTDDIAPGYSSIIKQSMDLQTIGIKIENYEYSSLQEFKDDFTLMCNNAMTYNAPETQYYQFAKKLLNIGLKIIQKEISLRPDIRHGLIPSTVSPQPPPPLPPPSNHQLDYSSPFLFKIDLSLLNNIAQSHPLHSSPVKPEDNSLIDVGGEPMEELVDQSHLTQIQVGFDEDVPMSAMFHSDEEGETEEEILEQVDRTYEIIKENRDTNIPPPDLSFFSTDEKGKTVLHILNPDSVDPRPVNLNILAEKVKAGDNASTVLNTELPVFKATPVSYLMYGPFGSFAPTYDTSFANLTKHDSALLLSTYGNEVGVSYANSIQQFVKGCGSFVTDMADAILTSLTNGRHAKFAEMVKREEEKKNLPINKKSETSQRPEDTVKQEDESKKSCEMDTQEDNKDEVIVLSEEEEKVTSEEVMEGDVEEMIDESGMEERNEREDNMEDIVQDDELQESPGTSLHQSALETQLTHTSELLIDLETQQKSRLASSPVPSEGHFILPFPSTQEINTASQVTSELVSMTTNVKPSDVASLSPLHNAMGISQTSSSKDSSPSNNKPQH